MPSRTTVQPAAGVLCGVALLGLLPTFTVADPPADSHRGSAMLLHNGNVLEGAIRHEGDRYHIFLPAGRVTVPATEVKYVGDSLTDIYQHKRTRLPTDRAEPRVQLVRWCLRNDLIEQASRELKLLEALDQKHPQIAILNEQIAFRRRRPPEAEIRDPNHDATRRRWDQMARRWSPEVLHQFATRIQPLLIRHCATAGCHGNRSAGRLRLNRRLGHGVERRAMTLDNLSAVLPLIDGEDPSRSPLLTYPIRAHANQTSAVFSRRDGQPYAELVDWARRAATCGSNRNHRPFADGSDAGVESGTESVRPTSRDRANAPRKRFTRK